MSPAEVQPAGLGLVGLDLLRAMNGSVPRPGRRALLNFVSWARLKSRSIGWPSSVNRMLAAQIAVHDAALVGVASVRRRLPIHKSLRHS